MIVNRPATSFEAFIIKWFVLPVMVLGLSYLLGHRTYDVYKCEKYCEAQGYSKGKHIPPDRFGFDEKCICEEPVDPLHQKPKIESNKFK